MINKSSSHAGQWSCVAYSEVTLPYLTLPYEQHATCMLSPNVQIGVPDTDGLIFTFLFIFVVMCRAQHVLAGPEALRQPGGSLPSSSSKCIYAAA
jgi:hypothetical protein